MSKPSTIGCKKIDILSSKILFFEKSAASKIPAIVNVRIPDSKFIRLQKLFFIPDFLDFSFFLCYNLK